MLCIYKIGVCLTINHSLPLMFDCIVYTSLSTSLPVISLHQRQLQSEAASIGSRRQPEQKGASPLTALQAEAQLCSTEGKHS